MKQKKGYWENTIAKALRYGRFSKTAKKLALAWNQCSIGEKLNFPKVPARTFHYMMQPEDRFLNFLGSQFADSIDQDDPITSRMIHQIIQTYDESIPKYAIHYLYTSGLMDRYRYKLKNNPSKNTFYLEQAIAEANNRAHEFNKKDKKTNS